MPEFKEEAIREIFVYSYRIIYEVQNTTVMVVAIIHGKRLLEPMKGRLSKDTITDSMY